MLDRSRADERRGKDMGTRSFLLSVKRAFTPVFSVIVRAFTPVFVIVAVGIGLNIANPAAAQTFPDHLIRIVVPYPPAGPADVAARLIAPPLAAQLGQNVIIENQPGAGGRTGAKA